LDAEIRLRISCSVLKCQRQNCWGVLKKEIFGISPGNVKDFLETAIFGSFRRDIRIFFNFGFWNRTLKIPNLNAQNQLQLIYIFGTYDFILNFEPAYNFQNNMTLQSQLVWSMVSYRTFAKIINFAKTRSTDFFGPDLV
jgi:hypothetical protein